MSSISAGTTSTTTLVHSGDTTGSLVFKTNDTGSGGTTAVTIDTSQNVGIGTTSPSTKLDVVSSSDLKVRIKTTGSGNTAGIDIMGNNATVDSNNVILYQGGSSEGYLYNRANSYFVFGTNNTERMRIDSSGTVLVNQTSASGANEKFGVGRSDDGTTAGFRATNASQTSDVVIVRASRNTTNGTFRALTYYNDGAGAYKFWVLDSGNCQNTNGSYGAFSDIKLKENIVDASPKLNALMQVKVRNYNLIGDNLKQIGVIAQELETVFPAMVEETPDKDEQGNDLGTTTKGVKYSVFVPMLIKGLQELKAINDQQAETINALTARVVALESK